MTVEKVLEACEHDGSYIPVNEVKRLMKEYACIKCLEAIRNTRHKACEIMEEPVLENEEIDYEQIIRDVQNISNRDVMPEL